MSSSAETVRRLAYVNGAMLPEPEARISVYDASILLGDCVFDTLRTFGGALRDVDAHFDRLTESLAAARLDPGLGRAEMIDATERLVAANRAALREGEDYWVTIRISSGVKTLDGEAPTQAGATIMITCQPLPLRARAALFRDGVDLAIAGPRRAPPSVLSPHVKSTNYLAMMIAQREVSALRPGAWAIQLDERGGLAEGAAFNVFIVSDGEALTPPTTYVLDGVTRRQTLELCGEIGVPCEEAPIPPERALAAQEAFVTSTTMGVCPVRSLDGHVFSGGAPGPLTRRIMDAFADSVGMDYVAQYLRFAPQGGQE